MQRYSPLSKWALNMLLILILVLFRAGGSSPTTLTLVTRKILPFTVKVLCFKILVGPIIVRSEFFSNGRTNLALLPPLLLLKHSRVTTSGNPCLGKMQQPSYYPYVRRNRWLGLFLVHRCICVSEWRPGSGGVLCLFIFPVGLVRGPPV